MEKILLNKKEVAEYIDYNLRMSLGGVIQTPDEVFNHNTAYNKLGSIILSGGLCSIRELNKRSIEKTGKALYTKEELNRLDGDFHFATGTDGISFSKTNLDDLYPDEWEYEPLNNKNVNIIIPDNKEIREIYKIGRNSYNYGNEFVSKKPILPIDEFIAVDFRLLSYIKENLSNENSDKFAKMVIETINKYNSLLSSAEIVYKDNLKMPFRENSDNLNRGLDTERLAKSPQIILVK